MKAMILCGGEGTRLREFTEVLPKPLVEIGGRPILWHIMNTYAAGGVTEFICCLGYKGNAIRHYFLNYEAMESDFTLKLGHPDSLVLHGGSQVARNWTITLAETGERAMTGARVIRGSKYLGNESRFCLTYGDGVTDLNVGELIAFHERQGVLATLTGVRPPSRFGEIEVASGRVTRFQEKSQIDQGLINGGYFVVEREFLRYLSSDDDCVLEREPLERCARDGQLAVFQHPGFWYCMDTYRDWKVLDDLWRLGNAPWKVPR